MPSFAEQLKIHPRGFGGAATLHQPDRTPKAFGAPMSYQQYRVSDFKKDSSAITCNTQVETLYASYIRGDQSTGDFNFRESILKAAMVAFGTKQFDVWFASQYQLPPCGDMHSRFLDDTLKFIDKGRRDMPLETWAALVLITDEGSSMGAMSDYALDFFGVPKSGKRVANNNIILTEVLQKWCSKDNGLEDLLGTLHILFGNA